MRKVLLATDFSASAELALRCARGLLGERRSELILVHVRDEVPFALARSLPDACALAVADQEAVASALHAFAAPLRDEGIAHRCLQVVGSLQSALLRVAAELGVDLIVMGAARSHPWPRAERLARVSTTPVLITRDGTPGTWSWPVEAARAR